MEKNLVSTIIEYLSGENVIKNEYNMLLSTDKVAIS